MNKFVIDIDRVAIMRIVLYFFRFVHIISIEIKNTRSIDYDTSSWSVRSKHEIFDSILSMTL